MGRKVSLRSRAAHFVSDLTTVLLNPISDKPSGNPAAVSHPHPHPAVDEDVSESKRIQLETVTVEDSEGLVNGPDTSSFSAFLYSLLSSETGDDANVEGQDDNEPEIIEPSSDVPTRGSKKSLFSRGKSSLGRVFYGATRISANQYPEQNGSSDIIHEDGNDAKFAGVEMGHTQNVNEPVGLVNNLPDISEASLLLSEKTRRALYASLPAVIQGRKWLMLYSTWRHGISLSTLYRRSMLWPGPSLLVVGDRKGAVFGGLIEAPLKPTNKRKYQGTNSTFVFTNTPGQPVVFQPTGANRYFTLCSNDFLAIGGGSHFALYLDADLLNGSSSVSETYGNPCLALSEDFEVKEVELWGFVYVSKYDEILALSVREAPGICRW